MGVLGSALGTNAKDAGSLSDPKDEKVLPRRYDNAIAYQEKLRQVSMIGICTRDQLTRCTSVLLDLSYKAGATYDAHQSPECPRTNVGLSFLSTGYLNPTFADAEEADAPTALRDFMPERFSNLEKELVRGKGKVVSQSDIVFYCNLET